MERRIQDHQQDLQRMRQQATAEVQQLNHEAKLKKEAKEVSSTPQCPPQIWIVFSPDMDSGGSSVFSPDMDSGGSSVFSPDMDSVLPRYG